MTSMNPTLHTRRLIEELTQSSMRHQELATLRIPLNALIGCLNRLPEIASEIDDPRLNVLMMQMALYSVADPEHPDYDPDFVKQYMEQHKEVN